jgi:hypothetical protein
MAYNPDSYSKALDDHEHTIRKALNGNQPHVFFSAYKTDPETGDPINNLNEVAIEGKCILFAKADDFWGDGTSVDYYSPVLENPTWLDVAVHADAAIIATRDFHHNFLEGVYPDGKDKDGIAMYEFSMGS